MLSCQLDHRWCITIVHLYIIYVSCFWISFFGLHPILCTPATSAMPDAFLNFLFLRLVKSKTLLDQERQILHQAYSSDMLGIGNGSCIFQTCYYLLVYTRRNISSLFATVNIHCCYIQTRFSHMINNFHVYDSGTRLSTSTGMHLIHGQSSVCLMIVRVLEEVAHFR